ncbi:tyrosine-type recombinase/integrase [Aliarcobacter lanthieri]|uniref:tyrosine-type recombinase/integrase n=1 Tax=Aliarcobacter lanthieri TaxID=1355374 RepID=UPI00047CBD81|nr:tyrosine-type recombinase/integrase [Aliarcobacter lanthieri]
MKKEFIYIEKLKNCNTFEDINKVMYNLTFPSLTNKFNSDFLNLPLSTKQTNCSYFNGTFNVKIIIKLIIFLKLDGYLGNIPKLSGKKNLFTQTNNLINFFFENYNIHDLSDIKTTMISDFIKFKKDIHPQTISSYLKIINCLIIYGNKFLPSFLNIDQTLLKYNLDYFKIKKEANNLKYKSLIGNKREVFPIDTLIKIMNKSLYFLDNYSEDILLITEQISIIQNINRDKKNQYLYSFFNETKHKFSEPTLIKIQKVLIKEKYQKKDSLRPYTHCLNIIEYLQSACAIIIYSLTGMRSSELINLERNPKIEHLEYYSLKRVITKTSNNEIGDENIIPVPEYVVKAINCLSAISEKKDINSCKNIIIGSFYYTKARKQETTQAMGKGISKFCNYLNEKLSPTPHQLRHCLAYLFLEFNYNKDIVFLLKKLYGHKSIFMVLQYFTHIHKNFIDILDNINKTTTYELSKTMIKELREGRKIFGKDLEKIFTYNYSFKGSYIENFTDLLENTLIELIKHNQIRILQTPYCLCIHNINDKNNFKCQQNFEKLITNTPIIFPAKCESVNCKHSIFLESHIEHMKKEDIDIELQQRLMQNTLFVESGGFENIHYENKLSYLNKHGEIKNG